MVFGLFKDGKEVQGWFWNCTGSPVVKSMQISLHIHSFCTFPCTWSSANFVGFIVVCFFFFSPRKSLLSDRKQPLMKLIKMFLIYQLKGETLDFLELWLHSHQCLFDLYSCCEEKVEHMNVYVFSNFYYIKRKIDPSETI